MFRIEFIESSLTPVIGNDPPSEAAKEDAASCCAVLIPIVAVGEDVKRLVLLALADWIEAVSCEFLIELLVMVVIFAEADWTGANEDAKIGVVVPWSACVEGESIRGNPDVVTGNTSRTFDGGRVDA
mmetsp:Transcript_17649/g.23817  ORF Transcript_17649/g.23817 Transcript_17649/m.23817 type:complete len:127 (-) Transcript_17649:561-941(-)